MMGFIRKVSTIIWKDMITELRTKEIFSSVFIFAIIVIIIFNFTFEISKQNVAEIAPGILWVAFVFAGMLGLSRSFVFEKEKDCIHGLMLCPVDRSAIYLGKMIGNLLFMFLIEIVVLPIFSIFFNYNLLPSIFRLFVIISLGNIGFASLGTLFSAMSVNTKTREVMLPILLFPIIIPVIIGVVKSTGKVFLGKSLTHVLPWLKLLAVFDIIFLVVSFLVFEYVIEE